MGELVEKPENEFTQEYVRLPYSLPSFSNRHGRERREHRVFQQLLRMVPGLEERIMEGSGEEIGHVADLVR
jgi:hypothetical protein